MDYAFPLTGKCLRDFLSEEEQAKIAENGRNKGELGNLVERYYFRINPGSRAVPDFEEAGMELKTAAVVAKKRGKEGALPVDAISYRAKERLKLSTINYEKLVHEEWEGNSLFKKCGTILLLLSLFEAGVLMIDRKFVAHPIKWTLTNKDIDVLRTDWETIVAKVARGEAHLLSGSDTLYLEACTSGSGQMRSQPMSDEPAKERSFAFKSSFVNVSMIEGARFVDLKPFLSPHTSPLKLEDAVKDRLGRFEGQDVTSIAGSLGYELSKAKHRLALLSKKMLGVDPKKTEEFVKADIEVKSVMLNPNGTPNQDVSFPAFDYMDIVDESWEDSVFNQKINTRVLFMIYQKDEHGNVSFVKPAFWSMPLSDFKEAERVWTETKRRVMDGKADNLPSKKYSTVAHVRNHARDSKPEHRIPSPRNGMLAQKGFWLNAQYIRKQLETLLD